jgi:hypothetical protein
MSQLTPKTVVFMQKVLLLTHGVIVNPLGQFAHWVNLESVNPLGFCGH